MEWKHAFEIALGTVQRTEKLKANICNKAERNVGNLKAKRCYVARHLLCEEMLEAESENILTSRKLSQQPGMRQRDDAWLHITTATRIREVYLDLAQDEFPGQPGMMKNKLSICVTEAYPSPRRILPVHTKPGPDFALVVTRTHSAPWGWVCYTLCRRFDLPGLSPGSGHTTCSPWRRGQLESGLKAIRRSNQSWSSTSYQLKANVAYVLLFETSLS